MQRRMESPFCFRMFNATGGYSPASGVPEWAWMMHLSPLRKTQYGFLPLAGHVLPFPMATMPCMHMLADIIAPPAVDKKAMLKEIAITMTTYNIGAVAEKPYTNGVTAFAGKAYMLPEGLQKERQQIVGLQECRSKEGGAAQIGDYQRVIPDVKGPAAGDVELWFITVTS